MVVKSPTRNAGEPKKKIEELQLQVLPGPNEPKLDAPGGFLFVNWEKSSSLTPANRAE